MARFGVGFAAVVAAVWTLGATPAQACGNDAACPCHKGAQQASKAPAPPSEDATQSKDAKATTHTSSQPDAAPAPAKATSEEVKPSACELHPGDGAVAGKCACKSASDCTCKKGECSCAKCSKRHAGEAHQDA